MKYVIPFLVLILSAPIIRSQDSLDLNTAYVSLDLGVMGGSDTLILGLDGGLGYQWTKWVGGGISFKKHSFFEYNPSGFSAFTLQYRMLPNNWLIFEAEYRWILDHSDTDDILLIEYIPVNYNLLHFYGGVKLNSWLTIGLSTTFPEDVKYKVCRDPTAGSFEECNDFGERYYQWYPLGLLINVGMVIK